MPIKAKHNKYTKHIMRDWMLCTRANSCKSEDCPHKVPHKHLLSCFASTCEESDGVDVHCVRVNGTATQKETDYAEEN